MTPRILRDAQTCKESKLICSMGACDQNRSRSPALVKADIEMDVEKKWQRKLRMDIQTILSAGD